MKSCSFFLILGIMLICTGCSNNKAYSKSGFYFDTVVTITLYDNSSDDLIEECFQICEEFEDKLSNTSANSEISKINSSNSNPVSVSDETIELLKEGIYYSELSDGYFDITIGSLTELWDFDTQTIPNEHDIQTALSHTNYKNIQINGNTVSLSDPSVSIDLGGIAKGYIADCLKEYLLSNNVQHAIINLGGNILTIGNRPDGTPFNIGIVKPFSNANESITTVKISDKSVVTAGVYERYFKNDNHIYHHILDTTTGYPCDSDLLSATIISDSSLEGDALSTICMILGRKNSLEFLKQFDHVDAILVTTSYEIINTRQ